MAIGFTLVELDNSMTSGIDSLPLAVEATLLSAIEALEDIEAFEEMPPSSSEDKTNTS